MLGFLQIEVCGRPALSKYIGAIFQWAQMTAFFSNEVTILKVCTLPFQTQCYRHLTV